MANSIDKLLLNQNQLEELRKQGIAYNDAAKRGDRAGMAAAHQRAESIRAQAGYSGGASGNSYQLLRSANAPKGYNAYEKLLDRYAASGMNAISAGYENTLEALEKQKAEIEEQGKANQASARSAAWNAQRMAADGLLTRGLENTGVAGVITATALNEAAENAYRALLDQQKNLKENQSAKSKARADALSEVAELQENLGNMLGNAYEDFYQNEADRKQELLMQQLELEGKKLLQDDAQAAEIQKLRETAKNASKEQERDYYYDLALAKLKRQWQLQDAAAGR